MKKLVQINVTAASGSHGMIAEEIGRLAKTEGWESWIAYGRWAKKSESQLIRIGSDYDVRIHGLQSRLLDNHGLASKSATRNLIKQLEEIQPDIIHLHNIHGYYLNYPILFDWLRRKDVKVVWTLHDCWPITGHCAHFMGIGCDKWRDGCHDCKLRRAYPASILLDRSARNHRLKKEAFSTLGNRLTLVACSEGIAKYYRESFLQDYDLRVIHNGVDINVFRPSGADKRKMILGIASTWTQSKGLDEFIKLRSLLPSDYEIQLIGLSNQQIRTLPPGISGMNRTANVEELVDMYSRASAFVNPTFEDSFPTVNLEALACGTPVVTYRTGGSPEAIDEKTGIVVDRGDLQNLSKAIIRAEELNPDNCRQRALEHFDKNDCFRKYIDLYNEIIRK